MPAPETARARALVPKPSPNARTRSPSVLAPANPSICGTKPHLVLANRASGHLHRVAFRSLSLPQQNTAPQLSPRVPNHTYHRGRVRFLPSLPPSPVSTLPPPLPSRKRPPRRTRMRRRAPAPKP
ncbi:hypothetical protein GQ55_9G560400 [Panicum hallii var. hallii]|uniref:Uncharacterized protein n=1 Tax=Panicum hallii var. hallii TaxID=1504633 RepID=A0A2T7CFM5_9POAL|nr:hypothetical protein GQ55_9G560400 [Panicum hallii var. hallii]